MIEHNGIFVQRMSRQIDTYQFPLFIQTFQISPTLSRQNLRCCNIDHIFSAKQRINCSRLVGLVTVTITHQCFKENFSFRIDSKKLFTFQLRKTIKTTRQRKAFHILLITSIQVDPLYKIKDTLIRRSSMILCTAASPTPFTAPRPKRMSPCLFTVNFKLLSFTSGPNT